MERRSSARALRSVPCHLVIGLPPSKRAGRWFDERDDAKATPSHWPEVDAITRRVTVQFSRGQALTGDFAVEIVGVVGAMRPLGFDSALHPELFLPTRKRRTAR